MVRKTVSIDDDLFRALEEEGFLHRFKNFSELVCTALYQTLENARRNDYRKELEEMSRDPMVLSDIEEVQRDFRYSDGEVDAI